MNHGSPPPLISMDALKVERRVDPSGQVVSFYVFKDTGQKAPLPETYEHLRDPTKFVPPPA